MEVGEVIITETTIDQITEIDQEADGIVIGQVTEVITIRLTVDKVTIDPITDRPHNEHIGIEVKAGIGLETIIMTIREVGVETEMMADPFSLDRVH